MDKHVLLVVVELLLLVVTQAHTQTLRGSSSSSSSDTSSSMAFNLPSHAIINAGDPPPEPAVNLRGGRSESSSSIHDVDLIDAIRYSDFPSTSSIASAAGSTAFAAFTASSKSVGNAIHVGSTPGTSSSDETGIPEEDAASPESESERASVSTTAPVSLPTSTTSSSDEASQLSSTPSSFDVFQDGSSYLAGTVSPKEERSDIESTKLELSTSHEAASSHSSHSSKKATSTTDQAANSNQDGDDTNGNNSTKDPTSSNLSLSNPIVYACGVLAVAGLVGGIFAFRAKRKRNVSDEWQVAADASAETSPPRRDPPPSQVHVIIDDNHFALL